MATETLVIEIRAEIAQAKDALRQVRKEVRNMANPTKENFRQIAVAEQAVIDQQKNLANSLKTVKQRVQESQPAFAGYALSLLFFGQALQRTFTQIGRFGVNTFKEISATVEGTTNNATLLEGSFKFLGFTIGQALEPLLGQLIPIVISVAEWVDENEGLVASIVTVGIVLGALLSTGGALKLAYDGFVGLSGAIKNTTTDADGVASYDWKGLGNKIRTGIGIIAIVYAIEQASDALDALSEGQLGKAILSTLGATASAIGGLRLLQGKKGGGALLAIGIALDLIEEGKFFQTINSVLGLLFALIETTIQNIGAVFETGFVNSIKTAIVKLLSDNAVIGLLDELGITNIGNSLNKLLKVEDVNFDFGAQFRSNYQQGLERSRRTDQQLTVFIESLSVSGDETINDIAQGAANS